MGYLGAEFEYGSICSRWRVFYGSSPQWRGWLCLCIWHRRRREDWHGKKRALAYHEDRLDMGGQQAEHWLCSCPCQVLMAAVMTNTIIGQPLGTSSESISISRVSVIFFLSVIPLSHTIFLLQPWASLFSPISLSTSLLSLLLPRVFLRCMFSTTIHFRVMLHPYSHLLLYSCLPFFIFCVFHPIPEALSFLIAGRYHCLWSASNSYPSRSICNLLLTIRHIPCTMLSSFLIHYLLLVPPYSCQSLYFFDSEGATWGIAASVMIFDIDAAWMTIGHFVFYFYASTVDRMGIGTLPKRRP